MADCPELRVAVQLQAHGRTRVQLCLTLHCVKCKATARALHTRWCQTHDWLKLYYLNKKGWFNMTFSAIGLYSLTLKPKSTFGNTQVHLTDRMFCTLLHFPHNTTPKQKSRLRTDDCYNTLSKRVQVDPAAQLHVNKLTAGKEFVTT